MQYEMNFSLIIISLLDTSNIDQKTIDKVQHKQRNGIPFAKKYYYASQMVNIPNREGHYKIYKFLKYKYFNVKDN